MKKYIFLAFLLIIGGGILFFACSYEAIVKKLVHTYGSQITGTDVSLDSFKLSLTNGEGRIQKIIVANPEGYKTPHFISLDGVSVKVDLKSLASDTIIIESIVVDKPSLSYEILSLTQNNIKEIQNNINNFSNKSATPQKEAKEEKPQEEKSASKKNEKKVIIKKLQIKEGEIIAGAVGGSFTVKFPTITMENIGAEKEGASISQTISKILNTILQTASQTVAKAHLGDLKNVAEKNLNSVVGGVKDRVKSLGIFGN